MKICSKCEYIKTNYEFFKDKRRKDGLANPCKNCKRTAAEQPEAKLLERNRMLKYRYDFSLKDWNALFDKQKGCCAICGKHQSELNRKLDVDHDHKTGTIRGLLCNCCNKLLERHINNVWIKSPTLLEIVHNYLEGQLSERYTK